MKRTIRRSSREDLAQTGKWSRRSLSQSAAPVCCPSPQRGEARAALALNLPSGDPTLGASGGGANVGPSPSLTVAFVSAARLEQAAETKATIGPVLSETNAETKREDVFKEQLMLMSLKSLLCVSFSIVSIQRAE